MLKRGFLLSALFPFFFSSHAQEFEEGFANSKTLSVLLRENQLPKEDSNKVRCLLSLSEYHIFYNHDIDTAIGYAQKSHILSLKISYQTNAYDSSFSLLT